MVLKVLLISLNTLITSSNNIFVDDVSEAIVGIPFEAKK